MRHRFSRLSAVASRVRRGRGYSAPSTSGSFSERLAVGLGCDIRR